MRFMTYGEARDAVDAAHKAWQDAVKVAQSLHNHTWLEVGMCQVCRGCGAMQELEPEPTCCGESCHECDGA